MRYMAKFALVLKIIRLNICIYQNNICIFASNNYNNAKLHNIHYHSKNTIMFTTLNNDIAKHIVMCAINQNHRFCAYSLYNHYKGGTFDKSAFHTLFKSVINILDDKFTMMTDENIDILVRDFIYRYYGNNF